MEKIFLCSHGSLAEGLLGAVEAIIGADDRVKAYCLDRYEAPSVIEAEIKKELSCAENCAILCDIKGGSVHNALMRFCSQPNVTLLTGMNLAMALELIGAPDDAPLADRCAEALTAGGEDQILFDRKTVADMLAQDGDEDL